ncbi:MAG: hypothetical protein GY761_03260 [Hyphomicrobiales bacterium]|nr:hypothetical protein [Hyphomicrobiales bacterium]
MVTTRKPRKTAPAPKPVEEVAPTLYPVLLNANYRPENDFELLASPVNHNGDVIKGDMVRRVPTERERLKVPMGTEVYLGKDDAIRVTEFKLGVRNDPFV